MDNKNWVEKSNALIQSSYKLSPMEHKIINLLASEIRHGDKEFKTYEFDVMEFAEFTGASADNREIKSQIHDSVKRLISKAFTFERGERTITTSLITTARTSKNNNVLELRISEDLKEDFIDLGQYTQYQLGNIMQIGSGHAVRIYELLIQYQNMHIKKREFTVNELKKYLGIEENEYPRFGNFEERILKISKKEINEKTNLFVTYKKIKKGRNIDKIVFEFEKKYTPEELEKTEVKDELEKMRANGFDTDRLLREYVGLSKELFADYQILALYQIAVDKVSITDIDPMNYMKATYEHLLKLKEKKKINSLIGYYKILLERDAVKMIEDYYKRLADEVDFDEQVEGQISIDELE